jgi:hypothetical protein
MKRPTRRDAEILLRLLETFNTPEMRESGLWFMKEFSAKDYQEFKSKYPEDSKEYAYVGDVLSGFETAGVLISHGLLNENLYFDASGIEFIWKKIGHIIPEWQKETSPALWENAVWLAQRQKQWKEKVWKPNQKWKTQPR